MPLYMLLALRRPRQLGSNLSPEEMQKAIEKYHGLDDKSRSTRTASGWPKIPAA